MEINSGKLINSLKSIKFGPENSELQQFSEKNVSCHVFVDFFSFYLQNVIFCQELNSDDLDKIIDLLCKCLEDGVHVEEIGKHFSHILLLIVTKFLENSTNERFEIYQKKCVSLSKIVKFNDQVLK